MFNRLRRTRLNPLLRDLVRETRLDLDNFIYPLFVVEGQGVRNEISSMPGVFQLSIDEILKECCELKSLGIKSILLFGIPREAPEYVEAKRLLKFLDYFLGVNSEDIPRNSIVREFIGGSCFKV